MLSGTTKYLIDANAIRSLSYEAISSKRTNNRILATIPEVRREVFSLQKSGLFVFEALSRADYETMRDIINRYECVRRLVGYYENEGAADVALLAHALTPTGHMFEDEIVIVTDDRNLRIACDTLEVKNMTVQEFKTL